MAPPWNPSMEAWPGGPHPGAIADMNARGLGPPAQTQEQREISQRSIEASAARQRIHDDPDTPRRIRDLAAQLIAERGDGTVPVVVDVDVPSRIPGRPSGSARAEIGRAWPVGSFQWCWKDVTRDLPTGVMGDGALVIISDQPPSVALKPSHRHRGPNQSYEVDTHQHRAVALARLSEAAAAAPARADQPKPEPRAPLVGRSLSNRQALRFGRLGTRVAKLGYEIDRLAYYGDQGAMGRPSLHERRAVARRRRLERRRDALLARRRRLGGG